MELRKRHVKNVDQKARRSGLFGIIDKSESLNPILDNINDIQDIETFKARMEIQNAIIEAEYRKAQVNELTRQMKHT